MTTEAQAKIEIYQRQAEKQSQKIEDQISKLTDAIHKQTLNINQLTNDVSNFKKISERIFKENEKRDGIVDGLRKRIGILEQKEYAEGVLKSVFGKIGFAILALLLSGIGGMFIFYIKNT